MPKLLATSRLCDNCSKTFHPVREDQRYCSQRCKGSARRKRSAADRRRAPDVKIVPTQSDGKVTLRDVRLNPSLNPLLLAWNQLDDHAKRIIEYAEKHLSSEEVAKAALGQEKINDGFLLLDEVAGAIGKGG